MRLLNKIRFSSKIKKDIQIQHNKYKNLMPITLNNLSLISPIKEKVLDLRKQNAIVNITRSQKKMTLIVPYRHREEHLEIFLPTLKRYLENQEIDYEILIIEQSDLKPFNRAKLLNIGVLNARKDTEYFVFHDVDFIPENIDYTYCNYTLRPWKYVYENNQYREYGETIFGGVVMIPKDIFLSINGFSNNYWQWGKEDDDLMMRLLFRGHILFYDTIGKFKQLPHPPSLTRKIDGSYAEDKTTIKENKKLYKSNKATFSKFKRGLTSQYDDGLNNLNDYKIISINTNEKIKIIKVDI